MGRWEEILLRVIRASGEEDFRVEISQIPDGGHLQWYVKVWEEGPEIRLPPVWFFENTRHLAILQAVLWFSGKGGLCRFDGLGDLEAGGGYEELDLALAARGF